MSESEATKLKRLQAKWKKKLEKSGFRDIENARGEFVDHQSVYDFSQRIGFRTGFMESIRDYYYWAEDMGNRGKFKSTADRKIWKLHAKGLSSREIAESVPFDNTWISRKIKKIRSYLKLQPEPAEVDIAHDEQIAPRKSSPVRSTFRNHRGRTGTT